MQINVLTYSYGRKVTNLLVQINVHYISMTIISLAYFRSYLTIEDKYA